MTKFLFTILFLLKSSIITYVDDKRSRKPRFGENQLYLTPINHEEVFKAIRSLKSKTSSGIDDMSAKLAKEIAAPLTYIVNKSFNERSTPNIFRNN